MDFLPPSLNSATIAGLLAIVLFSYYLLKRSRVGLAKTAPIPAGAWPVIGHLPLLGATQTPHITLGAMADKYGPLFTIKLGLHPALVLSSWEMAKECFTTNDLAVSSRPKLVAIKHLCYNYAAFGFAPHGPYWRELRKITTLELLSNRRLEMLSHVRVSEVENDIKDLYKLWIKKKNGSGLILVELKQWFGDMNLNVILRMIAGKRYFGTSDGVNEEQARRCQKALGDFIHLLGLFMVSDAIPFLGWLDLGGHEKAMKKTAKELDGILGEWLEEHKRKRASSENKGEEDFMDIMLSILDGAELEGYDADTINKATCLTMIAGGSDTSTVTLTWTIALLLNNHPVLKKVQDELDVQVGRERIVNESDISGYHVPKGTRLITNVWKIQTDPRIWSDPLEFKPERFLTTHKNVDVRGQNFELLPFGSGRRVCPGISFALQMVHLALASFLHMYDISIPSDAKVDMTETVGLTNNKATPLEVLIKPRLHLPSFMD
ncbi:hypothetical protein RGQ29_007114 [Quercus rubra]|uniref:Cytochrome P450 n=1 Tax=Quercus rubra TaxID=3512 RepID=A0AAN7I1D5_QUERU|nr:hypothetical protein RGQ29_007114 [Quercus rubra]